MDDIITAEGSSTLNHLTPEGIGTECVESITGYTARLASTHRMSAGQAISYEVAEVLAKPYLTRTCGQGGTRFYNHASMLNSTGQAAVDFTKALGRLTMRSDLLNLTMNPWRHVIPSRGLIAPQKKWCPACYQDRIEQGNEPYDQLLWALQPVAVCPVHKVNLLTKCQHCGREMRILDRKSRPGFCDRCGSWLGLTVSELECAGIDDVKLAGYAGEIIRDGMKAGQSSPDNIARLLQAYADQSGGGIAKLARDFDLPKVTVWDWVRKRNLPPLPSLLGICLKLEVSPTEILFDQVATRQLVPLFGGDAHKTDKKPSRRTFEHCRLEVTIKELAGSEEDNTSSLREVARRLCVPRKVLEAHFPEECKLISSRHRDSCRLRTEEDKRRKRQEIRRICSELSSQGIYPSRRKVEEKASWKAALRSPDIQAEWKRFLAGSID